MEKISKKENVKAIVLRTLSLSGMIVVLILTAVFHEQLFGSASVFQPDDTRNSVLNIILSYIPAVVKSLCAVIIGYLVVQLFNFIVSYLFGRVSNKAKTVFTLLRSLVRWIVIIAVLLSILKSFGVDITVLLAGLGILALVIGLGAQQIIADVIAGFFIVFESEFKVGDIITIDGWRGTVTDIGIRVTKLVDASSNVKIINNSDIKSVVNLTTEISTAYVTVSIDYDEDLNRVELVLRENLERMKKNLPLIIEGPFYKGVTELGASSVDLLFVATCKETDIYQVKRDINREIFLLFREHNITIPFNQITISERPDAPVTAASESQKKTANRFVRDQKDVSRQYEEENR